MEVLLKGVTVDFRLYRALRVPVPVIIPPVLRLLSSSSSGTITVGPFYYGIPLYEQPSFRVNALEKKSLYDGKK